MRNLPHLFKNVAPINHIVEHLLFGYNTQEKMMDIANLTVKLDASQLLEIFNIIGDLQTKFDVVERSFVSQTELEDGKAVIDVLTARVADLEAKIKGISSQAGHSARVLDSIVDAGYRRNTIKVQALPEALGTSNVLQETQDDGKMLNVGYSFVINSEALPAIETYTIATKI